MTAAGPAGSPRSSRRPALAAWKRERCYKSAGAHRSPIGHRRLFDAAPRALTSTLKEDTPNTLRPSLPFSAPARAAADGTW